MTPAQIAAVEYARQTALSRRSEARERLTRIVEDAGCADALERAMATVAGHARVVIHFHPDRIANRGMSVAEGLLVSGRFRNQFETGISSGSRTAFAGGPRDGWEHRLFGRAYAHASLVERPKYGALELIRYPDGPWPRFGSCYLVLRSQVTNRSTFTFSGSEQPSAVERLGTIGVMEPVFSALLEEVVDGGTSRVPWPPFNAPTLGLHNVTMAGLLSRVIQALPEDRPHPSSGEPGRVLDTGLEAQVHGDVSLQDDVECLVADPSFQGTATGESLRELNRVFGFPVLWHRGFVLEASRVPDDFRGPAVSRLAQRIAEEGMVSAAVIGHAEVSVSRAPDDWRDLGNRDEALQHLKQLWHVLVHLGAPLA